MNPPDPTTHTIADLARPTAQPMFYAAVTFSFGILLGTFLRLTPHLWFMLFAIALPYSIYCFRKRILLALPVALFALAAAAALQIQLETLSPQSQPDLSAFTTDAVTVTGHIFRSGLLQESSAFTRGDKAPRPERKQTVDVETEQVTLDDDAQTVVPMKFGIRVTIHSAALDYAEEDDLPELSSLSETGKIPAYKYGERIQFKAKLREPRNYGNPGAMDYRGYLSQNGIVALASVREDNVTRLAGFSGMRIGRWRAQMRRSLVEHMLEFSRVRIGGRFSKELSMDQQDAGILAAMIIGEQSLIRRNTRTDFQSTGTYHILVVSGMNVAILAFVIFWVAKRLRASEVKATIATIALSLFYAYMTDLGSPIIRAALMLSLYLGARLLYRDRFSLNAVGTAALIMLIARPATLFEASFQLTFLSVVVLSGIIQLLLERTSLPYRQAVTALNIIGYDATLAPHLAQFRLDLRLISGRISRLYSLKWLPFGDAEQLRLRLSNWFVTGFIRSVLWVYELAAVTAIMQVGLALPMAIYFHRMGLMGLPSNMVIVPLTAVLMPAGIVATLLSYFSRALAAIPIAITSLTLHAIVGTVTHLGGIRFANLRLAMPSPLTSALCVAAFLFAMFALRNKRRWVAAAGLAAIFAAAALVVFPYKANMRPGAIELTAIDVGQGDSILIVTPKGKTLLIDGGGPVGGVRSDNFDIGEDVVSPYLWQRGISRLDAVALTHGHSDHMSGLRAVIANFHPRELWVGNNPRTRSYNAFLAEAETDGVAEIHHAAGDEFDFGGVHITVLSPPRGLVPGKEAKNDDSLVMEIRYGATSALLAGDVERKMEHFVAGRASHDDLLKVAHHGSATSSTPELLAAVHPKFAVISVGYHSIFGHPKPAVLARLNAAGARVFRTDLEGAVTFYLDGKTVTPQTY